MTYSANPREKFVEIPGIIYIKWVGTRPICFGLKTSKQLCAKMNYNLFYIVMVPIVEKYYNRRIATEL